MFAVSPQAAKAREAFATIASSPQTMSQLRISTPRQWSGSMPSQLGASSGLRILIPSTSTCSQPTRWRVRMGASRKVTSRTRRSRQPIRTARFGPERARAPPFVRLVVARHEISKLPVDPAGPRQAESMGLVRRQQRCRAFGRGRLHSGHPALRRPHRRYDLGAAAVILRPGAGPQRRIVRQVEIDAALELERAHPIRPAPRYDDPPAGGRRSVDRPLDGRGVQRGSVADGAEIADIEFGAGPGGPAAAGRGRRSRLHRQRWQPGRRTAPSPDAGKIGVAPWGEPTTGAARLSSGLNPRRTRAGALARKAPPNPGLD